MTDTSSECRSGEVSRDGDRLRGGSERGEQNTKHRDEAMLCVKGEQGFAKLTGTPEGVWV